MEKLFTSTSVVHPGVLFDSQSINLYQSQSLFQYHIKSNIHLHQNIQKITIQDRHDIGEIAKGQIGLKWLSPLELIQIKLTSTKQIRLKQK